MFQLSTMPLATREILRAGRGGRSFQEGELGCGLGMAGKGAGWALPVRVGRPILTLPGRIPRELNSWLPCGRNEGLGRMLCCSGFLGTGCRVSGGAGRVAARGAGESSSERSTTSIDGFFVIGVVAWWMQMFIYMTDHI